MNIFTQPEPKTLESIFRNGAFQFMRDHVEKYAVIGDVQYYRADGKPMTRLEWYKRMKRSPNLDRLILEMGEYERARSEPREQLPDWFLTMEREAWSRGKLHEMV